MRNNIPEGMKELLQADERAAGLMNEQRYPEAEEILRGARDIARKRGWNHAPLSIRLSVAVFRQEKYEEALELILESLALSPLDDQANSGFEQVMQRMREVIEAADLPRTDPRIPRYYRLLTREGEATVETHLAMLRHLCAVGELGEAARIAEALALLSPAHPEVWRIRASVARSQGDLELANGCEAAVAGMSVLAFVPGMTAEA